MSNSSAKQSSPLTYVFLSGFALTFAMLLLILFFVRLITTSTPSVAAIVGTFCALAAAVGASILVAIALINYSHSLSKVSDRA